MLTNGRLIALLLLTATTTFAAPCQNGRNTRIQESSCTCGTAGTGNGAEETFCTKDHYCDAAKTSESRCSSSPFDRCTHTDGKIENSEDCKCETSCGQWSGEDCKPTANDCTAVDGRFCNTGKLSKNGCHSSSPYPPKVETEAPSPKARSLIPLENLGTKGCTSSDPCSSCQGNCNKDDDCRGALQCYKNTAHLNSIPGCGTEGMKDWYGYCYCNSDSSCEVLAPSSSDNNILSSVGVLIGQWYAIIVVVLCAVLQCTLCIKDRKRWKANLVPYTAEHTQPLQMGISAHDSYAWMERWAANSTKWIVPNGCKPEQSGQIQGQGFQVGARFKTSYSKQTFSSSSNRRSHSQTTHTTTTWDVLEADQNQCRVMFRNRTKARCVGTVQMGNPWRGHNDCTFHFQDTPNGCVLVIATTMYNDTNANFLWWKNICLILWCIPPFCVFPCFMTFVLRCWSGGGSEEASQKVVVQACRVVGQRISLGLQGTIQNSSNNNMQQQQSVIPIANEVIQQPLPGSMGIGSVVSVAPMQQMFQVQIPNGSSPGQVMTVQAPNGQLMQISVPANGVPGTSMQVPYNTTLSTVDPMSVA